MRRTTARRHRITGIALALAVAAVVAPSITAAEPTPTAQDEYRCLTERFVYGPAGAPRDTDPPAPITAASVVEHYIDVGRRIGLFAQDRGAPAASRLWEAFRYIRINDALIDPAKRDATDTRLRRIDDSLAAQYAR